MVFQNCGGSTLKATSSDNGGLPVQVFNGDDVDNGDSGDDDNNGGDNGGGDPGVGGNFSFNLAIGDNIFYKVGGGNSLNLATSRILAKLYDTYFETHIYEEAGVSFQADLPTDYCENSALPHCAHMQSDACVGYGCFKPDQPVRCHWQKRMSKALENNSLAALSSLRFLNRQVSSDDPMIADCNSPLLFFYKENSSLELSLAPRACVDDGQYYATDESKGGVMAIFNNEQDSVAQKMSNDGGEEFCNSYSSYAWNTSKWSYQAGSGMGTFESSFSYQVQYENQRVNMRWKEAGDPTFYCATEVPVQPTELDVFFPASGLQYEIVRTGALLADANTAEITYEDPVDGGSVWRLMLSRATAHTVGGGAVVDSSQASAINQTIREVLVNRARISGMAAECPQ